MYYITICDKQNVLFGMHYIAQSQLRSIMECIWFTISSKIRASAYPQKHTESRYGNQSAVIRRQFRLRQGLLADQILPGRLQSHHNRTV